MTINRGTNLLKQTIYAALGITLLCVWGLTQTPAPAAGEPATFDERLDEDDRAALAILFGANLRGNLEMCDCNHPRDGLARRVGYVEAFRKKFAETPVIQLEAGHFLYDSTGYADYTMLQNAQVAQAYSRWPVDVINLGRYDLIWARKMLAREGLAERVAALPMLKNLIAANGVFEPTVAAPPAFVVKEVTGPRIKGKKKRIRIGFVGLAEPIKPGGGMFDATVTNIFEAGRKAVIQARKLCDVLVIVAHSEFDAALRLARENPEADLVIVGDAETVFNMQRIGKTTVVCAAPGNTQEGDLRLYLAPDGSFTFKFRSTDLDALVPADPSAAAYTETARQEFNKLRNR